MKPVLVVPVVLLLSMTAVSPIPTTGRALPSVAPGKGGRKSPAGIPGVPLTMSYQGLSPTSSGTPVQHGDYDIQFDLFQSPVGGSTEWTETQNSVAVSKGAVGVILELFTSPSNFDLNGQLHLGVTAISGLSGPSYPITFPRPTRAGAPAVRPHPGLFPLGVSMIIQATWGSGRVLLL